MYLCTGPFNLHKGLFLTIDGWQGFGGMNPVVSKAPCFCFFIPGLSEADYFIAHSHVCEAAVDAVHPAVTHAYLWHP